MVRVIPEGSEHRVALVRLRTGQGAPSVVARGGTQTTCCAVTFLQSPNHLLCCHIPTEPNSEWTDQQSHTMGLEALATRMLLGNGVGQAGWSRSPRKTVPAPRTPLLSAQPDLALLLGGRTRSWSVSVCQDRQRSPGARSDRVGAG